MSYFGKYIAISVFAVASCISISAYAAKGCESWDSAAIASIAENGAKITLDDGSVWRVSGVEAQITINWLPNANIEVCNDRKLTNTDEGQSVYAKQIQ